ncbi:MAG: tetratricopeptide repeat protein, partial [Thermoguttaceae bacterium]|nr:tetratricopeptide repeat protein [Thermoguttaceae bacterium]
MRFPSCLRNVRRAPRAAALLAFFLSALVTFGSPNAARAEVGDDIVNQGLSLHSSQDYQSAINAFEDYARRYPNGSQRNRAELFAGHSYMLLHKYTTREEAAAAQQHFNYILNQGQNARYFKEALFHTAHLAYDMENFDIARARFQDFLRLYPNDAYIPYVLYYLANCETKFGNPSGALQLYERALRSYP